MAHIGQGGNITSFPNTGEKHCVSCDNWNGPRELSFNGSAATSLAVAPARCDACGKNTLPTQPCSCGRYAKWRSIR